jgi:acyl-CoA thioesterase II
MGNFENDTSIRARDGKLFASLSRNWEIWGPNGGYLSAIALRAAGAIAPKGHRPVTLTVQYLSVPQFDEIDCETDAVRKGRTAWCINVALVQKGKRCLQAQVWTTDRNDGPAVHEISMPDVPKHHTLKSWEDHLPKDAPRSMFWSNMEGKPLRFLPREESHAHGPVVREWYRFKEFEPTDDPFLDQGRVALLIDTLIWPAHARGVRGEVNYIAPTLDMTAWFHRLPGKAEWLFLDAHASTAANGLIHGVSRVWTEDGKLIATGGSNLLYAPRTQAIPTVDA